MLKILSLAALILLSTLSAPSYAAKLYKWVDKNGVTHFSQTPPEEGQTKSAEKVELRDTRALKPRKEGRYLYCGEERLRKFGDRSAVKFANLEQYIIDQNNNLDSLQQQRADAVSRSWKYKKSGFSDEVRRYDTQIETVQCKIGWAKDELAGLGDERKNIAERMNDLNAAIGEIEQRKTSACGVDNRTGFIEVDDEYRAYKRCIAPFDREISKLRREQRSAERDQKIVEGR